MTLAVIPGSALTLNSGSALLLVEQVENIRADLRWIGIPTFLPVPINLPGNTRKPMPVSRAPLANRSMGFGKTRVGSKMDGGRHPARWQPGALHPVVAGKRLRHFRPNLDAPLRIQIQGHMASWPRETCVTNERPDFPASRGNKLRQLSRSHAAPDHRRVNRL